MTVTEPRTKLQANYLNLLHSAAENMRRAAAALAEQAGDAANFSSTSGYRPDVYSQNLTQTMETIAVLNALMDQSGLMGVSTEDFSAALDPGHVYFAEQTN